MLIALGLICSFLLLGVYWRLGDIRDLLEEREHEDD